MNFGKTWWGQQWLQSLNNIDYSNRLPRGSSYAKKGAVVSLKISNNQITAKVSGSQPKPYNINIVIPPFFDPELSIFLKNISNKPIIISKLLNRELSTEILNIAESNNLKVFPKQWTDFKMQCSCPDWAVPCKHLAAVIYKVSEEIDNNPFLVFLLHNVDLLKELEKHEVYIEKKNIHVAELEELFLLKGKKKHNPDYIEDNAYQKLPFTNLTSIHEQLTNLLQDNPVFYPNNANFKERYVHKLNKIVKNAQKIIEGKISLENLFEKNSSTLKINHKSNEKIIIDAKQIPKIYIDNGHFFLTDFFKQLVAIPSSKIVEFQPATAALHSSFYFSLQLIANGAIVPEILKKTDKSYQVLWHPAMLSTPVREIVNQLENMLPPNILVYKKNKIEYTIHNQTAYHLITYFVTNLIYFFEENVENTDIFIKLFFSNFTHFFNSPGEEALPGGVMSWLQKYYITNNDFKIQIMVEELKNDDFKTTIHILEKNKTNLTFPIPLEKILTLKKYEKSKYGILQSINQLSGFIVGLDQYLAANATSSIEFKNEELSHFILHVLPAIQLLDIDVLLPKSLQNILKPKASIKVKVPKEKKRSFLRLEEMLNFDWQIAVGDEVIPIEEFQKILSKTDGLIKYKKKYIYVSKKDLEKLFKHFNENKKISSYTLLRSVLSGEYDGAKIDLTDDVRDLIKNITEFKEIPLPKNLNATLRPYQERGYSWMYKNAQIGFGSVLADDMGLGKTLQVISILLKYKEEKLLLKDKILVIAPTGLITNWQAEITKFAPSLLVKVFHGTNRKFNLNDNYDIVISSYGVIRSDVQNIKKMPWHTIVIDEAQNIKNINTAQTKVIKTLTAKNFIALSGTPVENKLSELWSIMDFSNRGFLGNIKEFNENFGAPIQLFNDLKVADKLKKITAPFLMRRLKTDKTIISDLPDKMEMDMFASLTIEQAAIYKKTLEEAMKEIEDINGTDNVALFKRQGLVLHMILALKQICNHPTQFLKNNILQDNLSGKMALLYEQLDNILECNEKVLIFTQFTEMGNLLKHFITNKYNEDPLFYHGGCSLKQRSLMVNNFQNNRTDRIFILSLKAAGTGLNLTAANHVIHYDLWWNPAVENQATDRAYRIGQKNNVMVYRFITKNTFEEKINAMIQSKKHLANISVSTGENWIGNLSNKELRTIFEIGN